MLILFPLIGSLGAAWMCLATDANAATRRSPAVTWTSVVILATMPAVTLSTLWPLRLAFLAARPSMERLADRVATGQNISLDNGSGHFAWLHRRAIQTGRQSDSLSIPILADAQVSSGFMASSETRTALHLLIGTDTNVELGRGWSYRQDD